MTSDSRSPRKINLETFLQLLEKSHLFNPQQLADARTSASRNGTPVEPHVLADRLIQSGELTRWQADQLLAGRHTLFVGKYKLLELLGSGSMGSVFRAEDTTQTGRIVAIKIMSPALVNNPESQARFQREIEVSIKVRHPNIIEAYEADTYGKLLYLVMEYVVGRDLKQMVEQAGALPIGFACECVRQAALGLQHAHELGLVHRDIKPANMVVMWDVGGRPMVKLLDLGLARILDEKQSKLTASGQFIGTPDYISPEQAQDNSSVDTRSDIFSLGITLFELLTGKLPFAGKNIVEKITTRLTQVAPQMRQFRREIPPPLDVIASKMLAREPAQRPSATDVAKSLAPFANAAF